MIFISSIVQSYFQWTYYKVKENPFSNLLSVPNTILFHENQPMKLCLTLLIRLVNLSFVVFHVLNEGWTILTNYININVITINV